MAVGAGDGLSGGRPLEGIIGACLTPWAEDGSVDGDRLGELLDFMVGHCDAVSILGVEASEYRALSGADRRAWLRRGIAQVAGRVPVLAGASSPRVAEVIELAELAAAAGADYAQVLIPRRPWGPEAGTAELVRYFAQVADASPLPLIVYHNPTRGSDPPIEAFLRLAEVDGVAGFKESSRDIAKIGRLIDTLPRGVQYFTTMQPLLASLLVGGAGAMMPVPATLLGARLMAAYRAGDLEAAAGWQRRFGVFPATWATYGLTPIMRVALRHLGLDIGGSTPPFAEVSPEHDAQIAAFLAEVGLEGAARAHAVEAS
ncbi:MAG TPA: dihydrodipicolinate synthase family protein [Acidimicrobiales bacterium]|jgi:4-hydroxy-tetrahydrodipicolinate synthase|nr:dihydrodipicolinate synthase family protein [Acidimicrobiales bacterium]